ncbi:MAG: mannosyltransferase [Candidatus Nanopelagicaceae bacterium]
MKFSHCEKRDWASPDNYIHACYTDIAPLYTERGLDRDIWAFGSGDQSVEYPVLMGVAMYLTTLPMRDMHDYYFLNIFLLALLFIFTVYIAQQISGYGFYYALAPAVIGSLFINWDLWAIPTMLLAIYWFDRKKYDYSAIVLGVSVATKFFPVLLLLPILVITVRNNRAPIRYLSIFSATWLAINLPVAITTPTGWWHFYKFNMERGPDWGSIWNSLQIFGFNSGSTNYLSLLGTLAILAWVAVFLFGLKETPTLAEVSFSVFASALILGRVYSPQYVLWLSALAVIAIKSKPTLVMFWIWQVAELIYHVAIWQHLATISEAQFGLSQSFYGAISLLRLAASIAMIYSLARQLSKERSTQAKPWDFLFETASTYP